MTTITTRSGKGSPLTNNEVDANFTNLNDDKVEASGDSMTGNLSFGDSNKATFGAGSDLQIYHDGFNSYIVDAGTGDLYFRSASNLYIGNAAGTQSYITAADGGAVDLRYNGSAKLATTSTGIDVTGTAVTDGVTVAGNILLQTEGNELQFNTSSTPVNKIYSDDTYTSNGLTISADNGVALKSTNNYLVLDDTGTNEMVLNVDSGERMRVTSTGIDVTGTVTASHLTLSDSFPVLKIEDSDGTNQKLEIVSSSGASFLTARNGSSHGTINLRRTDGTTTARTMQVQSSGDIAIYADDGTTKAFYWDASTSRLGLGTTSPSTPLHVSSASVEVARAESTGTSGSYLTFLDADTTAGQKAWIGADGDLFKFYSNNSTLNMTMTTDGNVGIGTTSPAAPLSIAGSSTGEYDALILRNGNSAASGQSTAIIFEASAGTSGDEAASVAKISGLRTGAGSKGDLLFHTTLAGVSSERMRITSTGNVGIGTSTPSSLLELQGADPILTLDDTSAGGYAQVQALNGSLILMADEGGTVANSIVRFDVDGTERMRIDSSGNVGIGLTNPTAPLTVNGNSNGLLAEFGGNNTVPTRRLQLNEYAVSGINNSGFEFNAPGAGGAAAISFATLGSEAVRINNNGNVGIGTTSPSDIVQVKSTSNGDGLTVQRSSLTSGDYAQLGFLTTTNDAGTPNLWIRGNRGATFETSYMTFGTGASVGSERMRIDSSGNLLVHTTGTGANNTDGFGAVNYSGGSYVDIGHNGSASNGDSYVVFRRSGTTLLGSITQVSSTGVAYNTSSDQRLKDNIVDAPSASDDIDAIQIRSFDWKADGSHQKYGMIAQELQTVAPEAVSGDADSDEMMGVDYSKLVPMLVKEIQSLRARVAQLEGAN